MKNLTKFTAVSAALLLSFFNPSLKAQQVPNPSFETFQEGFNGVGEQPTGWKGSNVKQSAPLVGEIKKTLVFSDNGGRTGKCVYLHSQLAGVSGIAEAPAPAFIALGEPWNQIEGTSASSAIGGCVDGLNFTYRPDTLSVWIKRDYSSTENAHVEVYFWSGTSQGAKYKTKGGGCGNANKTNEEVDIRGRNTCQTTQTANFIGNGEWYNNQKYSNWTQIKVPITYFNNTVPQKMNIIISAANYPYPSGQDVSSINAGAKLWADDLSLIYSSKIHELRFNKGDGIFRPMPNFSANVLNHNVVLSQGSTQIPQIQAFRSGRQLSGAEITVTNGEVDGAPTIITVKAEDNSSTTTYNIYFLSQQSNNPRPSNILINGNPIPNFNPYINSYNVELPYGTVTCPEITVQKAEEVQTYSVTNCSNVPGTATVKVTAQDGVTSATYTINYTTGQLKDNTLQNILINETPIAGFSPEVTNYTVELPLGTTQAPAITPVSAYPAGVQTILVTNNGLSGTASTIQVSVPGTSSRTYRINFVISESSYAYLNDIKVGGVSLADFNAETLNYNYVLPRGTAALPPITWVLGEQNQTATLTTGGVNGETRIMVQAQNGNTKIYRINFSVERSENSLLNNILIGGVALENFEPNTLIYNIELPSGTTVLPEITYELGDYAQNARITGGGLNGVTTIRVTAENPQFVTIYTLNFSVILSANSQLNAILVGGNTIDGFSPEILNYNYILPENATECPDISVIKATSGQQVFIVKPALEGVATIKVLSETADGGENIYTINFQFELSADNLLDYIKLNGELIAGFDSQTTDYNVTLPHGSAAPAVEYLAHDNTARVFVTDNGLSGTQIRVTAQNGTTRTYSVIYNITPTNNVDLANIEIFDNSTQNFVPIENFAPQTTEYACNLAWRTNVAPAINPVAAESGQTITVFYNPVNDTTEIRVVAPNGVDAKSYFVYFPVEKSNICTLNSILIGGAAIADYPPHTSFHPQLLTYNITLPYGTTQTPNIAFEKGKINNQTVYEQNVEITAGNINEPQKLKVIAEDGTTQTYTLNFSIDMSSKIGQNGLNNILAGGVPVSGFSSETAEYSVVLPYGTTELPEITFVKKYPEQTVAIDAAGVHGTAKIKVYSNISGVPPTEYRIKFSVSDIPTTTLTGISFNGTTLTTFDPRVKTYIVPVTSTPTVVCNVDETKFYQDILLSNHKIYTVKITNQTDATDYNTYTFWYYYTNDVIPNASFENWVNAGARGTKPQGWTAPNDVRDRTGGGATAYTSDLISESTAHSHGNKSVYLNGGIYCSSSTQDFPSLITLGSFWNNEVKFLGIPNTWILGSSSGVNGGQNFRNTPDAVLMDYIYDRQGTYNDREMRFVFQLWNTGNDYSAAQNVANFTYTDRTSRGSWYTMNRAVSYSTNNMYPQRWNIIINANKTENTADLYPINRDNGKLTVDNLRLGYNSTLSNLFVNGAAVAGFNGGVNGSSYDVTLPAETMSAPAVTFTNAVPDQEVRITISEENSDRQRIANIVSTAEDRTTQTQYRIILTRPVAANKNLTGISIGGVSVPNFDPNILEYNVSVPNGTVFSPDILATKGEGHQNISYLFENKRVSITVAAENETSQIYIINFVEQVSDDAALLNIEVEGYDINFDAATTEYEVVLPANAQDIPQISFTKKSDGQTVILTTGQVNDTTLIRVAAEDSVHFNDYAIVFKTQNITTSHLLSQIATGNIPLIDFAPNTFDYTVNIGKLVFTKEFIADTIKVVYFADSVKCYIAENIYKVVFANPNSANAYLADIIVDGASISGYQQNQFNYNENWDGENLPDIKVVNGTEGQMVSCVWGESSITITVTAPDGVTSNEYVVTFVPSILSSNSLLADILLDNQSVANFEPNTFVYDVELPEGTTQIPVVMAVKGEGHQTLNFHTDGINAATTIVVTAQDGSQSTYTINFTVALSNNALLNEILVGGVLLENFEPSTFNYSYTLPYGTEILPVVDYVKGHNNQVVAVQSNGVSGNYIITVTSESGNVENQYVIAFSVALSNNAYLANISANNEEISGFFPEVFEYKLILPYGTENVPVITYVEGDSGQEVVLTNAATLSDTVFISVTAENGIAHNTYKISFEVSMSNNALLADILINGEPLRIDAEGFVSNNDFAPEVMSYDVTLPYGTTEMPSVEWVGQVADYRSVTFTDNGFDNYSEFEVVSQDGNAVNTYYIKFIVGKSTNSKLDSIYVGGVLLENFHSDTLHYTIYYPVGTQVSELADATNLSWILGDEHQIVSVDIDEKHTLLVIVTAQDGSQSVYVIAQIILKSSNALLKDIVINGVSLKDFEPTTFNYEYMLPFGASVIPSPIIGVKQEESQTVVVSMGYLGQKTLLIVTAEDGETENIYSIFFEASDKNPGDLPTKDDVCFSYYSDGVFKASSTKNNVSIVIFDTAGRLIYKSKVPLSDPNDDVCKSDGVYFHSDRRGQVFIYMFIYNNKQKIFGAQGKELCF